MLTGIGLAGAGAKAAGIDPEPYALGLSAATFLWSSWKSAPGIKATKGQARLRRIGADIVWPISLVFGTAIAGKLVGHAGGAEGGASLADVARAGGQATVIGIDVPTIAQTALDSPSKKK